MGDEAIKQYTDLNVLAPSYSALMKGMKAPKGYVLPTKELEELSGKESEYAQKAASADVDIEAAKRKEKASELEQKIALGERIDKETANLPEREALKTKREEFAHLKFQPTQQSAQDMAVMFGLISMIGMVVGKTSAQASLASMNGGLEGNLKGQQDLAKKNAEEFEKNFKTMQQQLSTLEKEYQEALALKQKDRERGELAIQLALAKADSPLLKAMRDKQGDLAVLQSLKEAKGDMLKVVDINNNLNNEAQKRADAFALKKMEITAQKMKENNKTAIPMFQGIRGIERLQQELRDPEVRTGLLSKTAPIGEKLKSIFKAPDNEDFESVVNRTLTGTDKTTLFLKDALLESYAIERAANGGARVTVQMMKQAGPVLDPTNYTPETYNALLDTRRKVLYDNLQDMGYTPEQIKKASAAHEYTPYGGEAKSVLKEIKTKEEYDALPSGSEFLEDGKKYRKP
jgi:uncharacterized protein YsxB (DUF464 family)